MTATAAVDIAVPVCVEHRWKHRPGEPLSCELCEEQWPGEPLPKSPNQAAGWGELGEQPSWYSRVASVRADLAGIPA